MQPVILQVLSKVSLLRQGALDGEVLHFTPDSLKPRKTLYISSSQQKQQQHGSETEGCPVAELLNHCKITANPREKGPEFGRACVRVRPYHLIYLYVTGGVVQN